MWRRETPSEIIIWLFLYLVRILGLYRWMDWWMFRLLGCGYVSQLSVCEERCVCDCQGIETNNMEPEVVKPPWATRLPDNSETSDFELMRGRVQRVLPATPLWFLLNLYDETTEFIWFFSLCSQLLLLNQHRLLCSPHSEWIWQKDSTWRSALRESDTKGSENNSFWVFYRFYEQKENWFARE